MAQFPSKARVYVHAGFFIAGENGIAAKYRLYKGPARVLSYFQGLSAAFVVK